MPRSMHRAAQPLVESRLLSSRRSAIRMRAYELPLAFPRHCSPTPCHPYRTPRADSRMSPGVARGQETGQPGNGPVDSAILHLQDQVVLGQVTKVDLPFLAEKEGFEPPEAFTSTVFKTAAFDHSATSPRRASLARPGQKVQAHQIGHGGGAIFCQGVAAGFAKSTTFGSVVTARAGLPA